jgi:hypothetical protein
MSLLKKIVEKKKAEKYAWPEGWMTREQAANDLGVAPRDVDDTLKEAVRDGDVLKQHFPLWDSRQGRVVRQPGYCVARKDGKSVPAEANDIEYNRVVRGVKKNPKWTDGRIAKNYHSTVARVAAVRKELGL